MVDKHLSIFLKGQHTPGSLSPRVTKECVISRYDTFLSLPLACACRRSVKLSWLFTSPMVLYCPIGSHLYSQGDGLISKTSPLLLVVPSLSDSVICVATIPTRSSAERKASVIACCTDHPCPVQKVQTLPPPIKSTCKCSLVKDIRDQHDKPFSQMSPPEHSGAFGAL